MAKVSLQRKREILDAAKGQIFQVTFVKADGSVRTMNTRHWSESAFTYGSANAKPNTVAHKPEYYTAVDNDAYKKLLKEGGELFKSWRNINLNTLLSAKVAGITYNFDKE